MTTHDGDTAGSAYLFVRSGAAWSQQAKHGRRRAASDYSAAVALTGDTALVGALWRRQSQQRECVCVCTRRCDVEPADQAQGHRWRRVIIRIFRGALGRYRADRIRLGRYAGRGERGERVCVRAQRNDVEPSRPRLPATRRMFFGCSVALSGDTAWSGHLGRHGGGRLMGGAYVFVRNGDVEPAGKADRRRRRGV